jgi:ABC-type lipoprotein release transport system permease subunit
MSGSDPVVYAYAAGAPAPALYVRTGSPETIARVRSIAAALEPNVVVSARPYESYMRDALDMAAVSGDIAWAVGGLGLVLAAVGAFGVFAYSVEHRRREIGIRLALGARTQQIASLVFRSAGTALLVGLAGGFVLSVFATPFLRTLLFGLSALDALAWLQVAAIVGAAVTLATWIPFRRAAGVDPATMLRED